MIVSIYPFKNFIEIMHFNFIYVSIVYSIILIIGISEPNAIIVRKLLVVDAKLTVLNSSLNCNAFWMVRLYPI